MAQRLITLATISAEKIDRRRSWILGQMVKPTVTATPFPQPVVRGAGSNLWDEADVDKWVAEFVAASAQRPAPPARKVPAKTPDRQAA